MYDLMDICLCSLYKYCSHTAGRIVVAHLPKPILSPSLSQNPLNVTVSPSRRNVRWLPSSSLNGRAPLQVSSSREPYEPGSLPLMVPDAYRSPTLMLQPVTV